jgi:hypothetical protein
MKNKITEIYEHDISWYIDGKINELDETSRHHIQECIIDGITQGELCISTKRKEYYGWWHIINWKDIALGLYNATKQKGIYQDNITPGVIEAARQRFDNEWTY